MSQQPPPPMLPPGWIAIWDETNQRYYYAEEASGRTQWELPTGTSTSSPPTNTRAGGEAASYNSASGYPPQQQQYSPYPNAQTATTATADGAVDERGMGKMFTGVAGGALAGSLLG
ncbi:hypothetical protein BDF20DRAFT_464771 [Mycotypha africana]|uniref:uncharacterized protein n=1 Tax=Mycotypha africana TaxID=64632 RepID=UPI0023014013|nr:uncharacterized protein BDF20DRAFT_464771 [Mycotypha africana]KAI8982327.1 hypothetical protein BDF20DRAFT_464771 [Mycotypha africana]